MSYVSKVVKKLDLICYFRGYFLLRQGIHRYLRHLYNDNYQTNLLIELKFRRYKY